MISSNYTPIFNLEVWHSYFTNGLCKGMQFVPAVTTMQLIKRYGFLTRTTNSGFEWYANTATPLPDYLNSITKATGQSSFEFDIITRSQLFYTYTDIDQNWKGQFIYSTKQTQLNKDKNSIQLNPDLQEGDAPILGKITFWFDDLINLIANGKPAPYTIQYQARATQWHYYIINRKGKPANNFEIKGKTDIRFTNPQDVTIASGEQALLFASTTLIPLHEKPIYKFDLVSNESNGTGTKPSAAKVIFKGLPNPDPSHIDVVKNINQLSSPMYVYI